MIVTIPRVCKMVNAEVYSSMPSLKGGKYRWFYTIKNHGIGDVYWRVKERYITAAN